MVRKSRSKNTNIELTEHDHLLISQIKKLKTQTTCFFNNKGGVGKTTLVANLGAELSINFSAKVLIVDADPQCNLTQYVFIREIHRRLRKLIVIPYNARNNHAELPELIEEMAEKVEIKMRTNIASMLAKTTASENT
ncbi:ParA family protein [Klebsiella variicola]